MRPGHNRQIVEELVAGGHCTARAACWHFGLHRSTFAYQAKEPDACLCIHVDRRINARKVRRVLSELIDRHGAPEHIRSDNGSEFIEKDLRASLADNQIKTLYIEPGSPWQNGYIESFNARFREECLNREQLWSLSEARVVIEDWRWKL